MFIIINQQPIASAQSFQYAGPFTTDAWEIVAPWPCFLLLRLLRRKGIGCYDASPGLGIMDISSRV